jgi:hypothetical protein
MKEKAFRSGERIKAASTTVGLAAAIAAPVVTFALLKIELATGIMFPPGYDEMVLVALTTGAIRLVNEIHMRRIQQEVTE